MVSVEHCDPQSVLRRKGLVCAEHRAKHQVKEEFSGHGQRQKHKTIRKMSAVEKSLGVPTPQGRQRSHTWDKTTEIISFILFRSKQVQPGEWGAGGIRLHLSRRVSKNVGLS